MSSLIRLSNRSLKKSISNIRTISTSPLYLNESNSSLSQSSPLNTHNKQQNELKRGNFNKSKDSLYSYNIANNQTLPESNFNISESESLNFNNYSKSNFKDKISNEDAKKIPSLLALHARLNLSKNFEHSTLVRCLTCKSKDLTLPDNFGLSLFGSNLLSFYTTEYLLSNYPRLPLKALKASIESYIGDLPLYDVAKNWGIEEDTTTNLEKYLSKEPKLLKFGRLRFDKELIKVETGITKFKNFDTSISKQKAFASSVRSIIASIYIYDGELAAKEFIYNHILLQRKLDIESLFHFNEPGKLLNKLLKRENLEPATIRLMSETGRLSSHPIFIIGVFSGENLLAEGQGNSLKEARIRGCVNALKSYYLYRPLNPKVPSDNVKNALFVDSGESFF
ncbi:hypothetical protein B5S28_g1027 [[Candida] boidinii]|nr:hypothetical protein B5S28_g1027 [[Candida] boidinii]OWB61630.1 hypothetical protein B5S29_g2527 [[Candida] boidinii]OWB73720.1 hypothetical protein B5S31_g3479 [[Candida] boidinii]OWB77803.1 hypothetical protein B5S32_g1980 [[Candida] boidinii]GME87052.1 unnamed protein product [[Candida] boidinii]